MLPVEWPNIICSSLPDGTDGGRKQSDCMVSLYRRSGRSHRRRTADRRQCRRRGRFAQELHRRGIRRRHRGPRRGGRHREIHELGERNPEGCGCRLCGDIRQPAAGRHGEVELAGREERLRHRRSRSARRDRHGGRRWHRIPRGAGRRGHEVHPIQQRLRNFRDTLGGGEQIHAHGREHRLAGSLAALAGVTGGREQHQ